jgi:two-component system, NtrC family, sensor kinase
MALNRRFGTRLETKVMAAVLAVLVALPAITLWEINRRLHEQMARDAKLALTTAQEAFEKSLRVRTDALAARFNSGITFDSRFLKILELSDAPTMSVYLQRDVLGDFPDTEIALLVNPDGTLFAKALREGAPPIAFDAFSAAADRPIHTALAGEAGPPESIAVNGSVFRVVAVPVAPRGRNVVGALVFGIRIGDTALRNARPPEAEILVVAGNSLAASTLTVPAQNDAVLQQLARLAALDRDDPVLISGQRFRPATGLLVAGDSNRAVRYILLSSVEQRMQALERTRLFLLGLSALGIVCGAAVVWFFVRRLTRPLVELRDSAEAVGRGDFSRRIARVSNDECGDLAEAFNRMTGNLQASRAELERAMQQVRTTQEQLIQSEKLSAVGQFVAGVAHELNNPLTAVVGFSELLQSTETNEKTRGHLERIAKSAHRCHKIVHSLLSFARQHTPERKLVDIATVVDEVLEIMAYDLRTSNVTIAREFAPDVPRVMADPHQLQQVFVNILGNARQAMETFQRDGRIVIRVTVTEGVVGIEFQDNGPGIKPEHLARIFDPFFTTKPVGKGTGLGLSLCYGIIQEHGGRISARSDPGQGATFAIELPVAPAGAASPALRRGNSVAPFVPAPPGTSGKSVLVIDDEAWILELAAELLRSEGHTVELALGGQQGMEMLSRQRFDVIVSDWKMPGLNGIRLYEHLQATDPESANRVLFMTGDVVSDTFKNFLEAHQLACLSKPFATGEFRAAVAKVFKAATA